MVVGLGVVMLPPETRVAASNKCHAQSRGEGVAVLNGKLIENLHASEATRTIALADAIASMSP